MRYRKLLLVTILIYLSFNVQNFAQTSSSVSINQFEGLEFDKKQVFMLCPIVAPFGIDHEEPVVAVTTKVSGQSQNLKYQYSVSGGRIVGKGSKINWDLDKLPPGLYTVRVDVRGKSLRKTFIKEIRLNPPPVCDLPCSCPNLSIVISTATIKEGKTAVFSAQIRGGNQSSVTYKWTVSEGEIFKGQGTSKVKVKTIGLKEKEIMATVEISGDFCAECYRTANSAIEIN